VICRLELGGGGGSCVPGGVAGGADRKEDRYPTRFHFGAPGWTVLQTPWGAILNTKGTETGLGPSGGNAG